MNEVVKQIFAAAAACAAGIVAYEAGSKIYDKLVEKEVDVVNSSLKLKAEG